MAVADYRVLVKKNRNLAVIRPSFDKASKGSGGRMEIINGTAKDIIVDLPGNLFDKAGALDPNPETVTVVPGKPNRLIRNVHASAVDGIHEFRVFCLETFSFAQGNSDPEIIIE